MRIAPHTRIILMPSDEGPSHEYGITRGMIVVLLVLALGFVGFLGVLMTSFATKHDERQTIEELETQLAEARDELQMAHELAANLEELQQAQEQVLLMLGVEGLGSAAEDSLLADWMDREPGSSAEALQRAATVVSSPRPDRWPARGFVTQEFVTGNPARGVVAHPGIDIAGPRDGPIVAAAPGMVARTGVDDYLGNFVEIQHGLGYLTVYGHCSRVAVSQGDRVAAGQVIAYVGDTGQATAPHLHFEIWEQGEAVDPRTIVAGEPEQK
ncbi:peptidoglycan DD-metalloendopeptidase family protein [bacterium]|nr:peptidoglycan DD-metalloendopeptidase family protein [bacterium]